MGAYHAARYPFLSSFPFSFPDILSVGYRQLVGCLIAMIFLRSVTSGVEIMDNYGERRNPRNKHGIR